MTVERWRESVLANARTELPERTTGKDDKSRPATRPAVMVAKPYPLTITRSARYQQSLTPAIVAGMVAICHDIGMETPDETSATATHETGPQPGSATGETLIVSVKDAAELLGISPQAVRKRIAAGTLPARKVDRSWQIILEAFDPSETDETATAQPSAQPGSATTQPVSVAESERYSAMIAPHLDRIERQAKEIGRLEAEIAERDRLIADLQALRDAPETSKMPPQRVDSPEGDESPMNVGSDGSWADRFRRWWLEGSSSR